MDGLDVVILVLATFRITRLIVFDTIFDPIRERTTWKLSADSLVRELFSCYWCMSVWVGAVVALVFALWHDSIWIFLALALSAATSLMFSQLDPH